MKGQKNHSKDGIKTVDIYKIDGVGVKPGIVKILWL